MLLAKTQKQIFTGTHVSEGGETMTANGRGNVHVSKGGVKWKAAAPAKKKTPGYLCLHSCVESLVLKIGPGSFAALNLHVFNSF